MSATVNIHYGAIAQLVERLTRTHEVSGSTPLSSTPKNALGIIENGDPGAFLFLAMSPVFATFCNLLQKNRPLVGLPI